MEYELDDELGYEKSRRESKSAVETEPKNYRNGYSKKTAKTQLGEVEISVPRDRNGKPEPQIISKYNRNADGMEEKILSLYVELFRYVEKRADLHYNLRLRHTSNEGHLAPLVKRKLWETREAA